VLTDLVVFHRHRACAHVTSCLEARGLTSHLVMQCFVSVRPRHILDAGEESLHPK
jgi:hypothetical protein